MTAQQVVTQYANLHLAASTTNRPIPSNQWWTDLLVGDRSYQPAANTPRTIVQDAFGGQLWAYPGMVDPEAFGFNLYFPNAWTPAGSDPWVPQGPFMTGSALQISAVVRGAGSFAAVKSVVTDWSDWSVRFSLPDAGTNSMEVTLARGVPFVWTKSYGVNPRINVGAGTTLYGTNGSAIARVNNGTFAASAFAFDYQGRSYGVFVADNTTFLTTGDNVEVQLTNGSNYVVYGLLPARSNLLEFAQFAYACVTNTVYSWTYDVTNGRVDTTWTLATEPLKGSQTNTLQGWLPHHYRTTTNSLAFKSYNYLTPRGRMKVASGNEFRLGYKFRGIAPVLPAPRANNLPNDYVASRMTNLILNFASQHPQNIADTYYAGKELGITAQHMSFARQLGMTNQVNQLASGMRAVLTNWLTYTPGESQYFFARYGNWRALIGFPADFGSEAFNDNHFHYGYFLGAAALLGMEDTNFLNQYGPMLKLVAKEFGNWDRYDTDFPFLRTFDIWEGHSWAGGFSSGGGNNQESSSEAMNSWVGLFLLGNQLGDAQMAAAGAMGYAVESTAVNEYWQDMYRTNLPASYGKGMVGILWSGGLTYGTYFDGDPAWIHGIQWVPANHWNNYLARDKSFANWQLTNLWNERVIASAHNINGFTLNDANNATSQGGYLGNYILGFQTLFDPDGVAGIINVAFTNNAAIATDATYAGVTYYLTHALRGLGEQDVDYYTSLPTSQVYYNAATGRRTYVVYNPTATSQSVTVYHLGEPVDTVAVLPGKLTVKVDGGTNAPSQIQLGIEAGAQIGWPTTNGTTWTLQSASELGTNATWSDLAGPSAGNGSTNTYFDPLWPSLHQQYQVLVSTLGSASVVVNAGFEAGSGGAASNWTFNGSQPPARVTADAHGGSYSLQLFVTNSASTPNTSGFGQNVNAQGGTPIVGGQTYNFSFWARQVSSGVSYVQNYRISWLNSSGGTISTVGWSGFTAGNGFWSQVAVNNLVAPINAVNAVVEFYSATGAVLNGYGAVLIDDVALSYATPSQTNVVSAALTPAVRVRWAASADKLYDVQSAGADLSTWTNLVSSVAGNGMTNEVIAIQVTNRAGFFRVRELP